MAPFEKSEEEVVAKVESQGIDIDQQKDERNSQKKEEGCWTKCWRSRTSWTLVPSSAFRRFFIFSLFLVNLSIITLGMTSESQYLLSRAVSTSLVQVPFGGRWVTFDEISSVPEIWVFLEDVAMPFLFPEVEGRNGTVTATLVLRENHLLGLPRLRQLRVRNDSCTVHTHFRKSRIASDCYSGYSQDVEDRAPFGLIYGTAWTYHSEEELDGASHWGLLETYGGGGSYEDFGPGFGKSRDQLTVLKDFDWISRPTRVVFLDFTIYNANVNLFSILRLIMELPPSGGVWSSKIIWTVKLLRYVSAFDRVILGLEIVFCCLTAYYLFEEILEISSQRLAYFRSKWNLLDILILIISVICIAFSVYRMQLINRLLKNLLHDPDHYLNFGRLGYYQARYDNAVAVLVFVCWIKVFKYLSFNTTMVQLSTTLSKCAKDVGGFGIMFFIIFLAYAQLGYLLFGTQLTEFRRLDTSILTMLRFVLGDFDYVSLEKANRILGPIFFVTFVFFVFFVLLNMFLAILNDTYTAVKAEMDEEDGSDEAKDGKFRIVAWIRSAYRKMKGLLTGSDPEQSHAADKAASRLKRKKSSSSEGSKESSSEVSLEDFEKLVLCVDDLNHELEQLQSAIWTRIDAIHLNLQQVSKP